MKCSQVQNLLSAYCDAELPPTEAAVVEEHLRGCPSCAVAVSGFKDLSQLASQLREPVAAPAMWHDIARQLDAPALPVAQLRQPMRWRRWLPAAAIAATLLIAVVTAISLRYWSMGRLNENLAVNFDDFLQQFPRDPSAAQNVLLASYDGRRVEVGEAAKELGYMPAAADTIPDGYAVQDVYLLQMPNCTCGQSGCRGRECTPGPACKCGGSCTCAQVVYRNSDGRLLSIFEHDSPQPVWFGNRPAIACKSNGIPTNLFQINPQQLAASWKRGNRYVTLVGAANLEEVQRIMEHLQATAESLPTG